MWIHSPGFDSLLVRDSNVCLVSRHPNVLFFFTWNKCFVKNSFFIYFAAVGGDRRISVLSFKMPFSCCLINIFSSGRCVEYVPFFTLNNICVGAPQWAVWCFGQHPHDPLRNTLQGETKKSILWPSSSVFGAYATRIRAFIFAEVCDPNSLIISVVSATRHVSSLFLILIPLTFFRSRAPSWVVAGLFRSWSGTPQRGLSTGALGTAC